MVANEARSLRKTSGCSSCSSKLLLPVGRVETNSCKRLTVCCTRVSWRARWDPSPSRTWVSALASSVAGVGVVGVAAGVVFVPGAVVVGPEAEPCC
eukprot:4307364-Pyramimonas_sp.AAC.1